MIRIRDEHTGPDDCECGDCGSVPVPEPDDRPGVFTTYARAVGCVWLAMIVAGVGVGLAVRSVVWIVGVGR